MTLFLLPQVVRAEDSHSVVVDAAVDADFAPQQVYFLVRMNDTDVQLQQALLLEDGVAGSYRYHAGTVFKSEKPVETIEFSLLAHGKGNQFWMKHFPEEELAADHPRMLSVEGMRKKVLAAKSLQKQWEDKLTTDKETLRRLRKDAEVIGNLGRITRLLEQLDLLKEEQARLVEDKARLQDFLKKASSQAKPKNFVRRQAELTGQLEELARIVQGVEESETVRKSLSEAELQRRLALIEETRLADADDLESQLKQLQQARKRIENDLGFDEGESLENYLSW